MKGANRQRKRGRTGTWGDIVFVRMCEIHDKGNMLSWLAISTFVFELKKNSWMETSSPSSPMGPGLQYYVIDDWPQRRDGV